MFDSDGYALKFIQRDRIKDQSAHLQSYIYKFFSEKTKLFYIVKADYHKYNVFAIKFYPKSYRGYKEKYNTITNKGDVQNILITCAKVIPLLLKDFPTSSFGFIGSPSIDARSNRVENYVINQRFRIYRQIVSQKIGTSTFVHFEYEQISAYLLINRANSDIQTYELNVSQMFCETYDDIVNI